MMEINVTLLVQIGNFLIAYFILRSFVFIPALRILKGVEHKQECLENDVHIHELAYQEQIRMQNLHVKDTRAKLLARVPEVKDHHDAVCEIPEITPSQVRPSVSSEEISKIKETIIHAIRR